MDIKFLTKFRLYIGIAIVLISITLVFAVLGVINNFSIKQSDNIVEKQLSQKSHSKVAVNTIGSQESTPIPERNINEAVNFLDMLGDFDDLSFNAKSSSQNTTSKTITSREEQLLQKYYRVKETPDYKAIEKRYNQLIDELYQLAFLDMLRERLLEYEQNPFSIIGLTKEEASQREWSDKDLEYIQTLGKNLEQQIKEYEDIAKAIENEKEQLQRKRLELLGMTEEEYNLIVKIEQTRRQT